MSGEYEIILQRLDRLQDLVETQNRQLCMLRGKSPDKPTMSTREAAALLRMSPRQFRRVHVATGNIKPVPHHKCVFHRYQVEALRDKVERIERRRSA